MINRKLLSTFQSLVVHRTAAVTSMGHELSMAMSSVVGPEYENFAVLIFISRPTDGGRLSLPGWLVTYLGGMPIRRQSPIQYQPTDSAAAGDRTHDH